MLPWATVTDRVTRLLGAIWDSPFETLGRFAAWTGISFDLLRQWESRGVGQTMMSRLLAEASVIALSDWMAILGERERLHKETGALNPIWEVGLMEDVGLNPARVELWQRNEVLDGEERLALLLCLTREGVWETRYKLVLADRAKRGREWVPASHMAVLVGLRRERLKRGYSQREAAEFIGCERSALSHWELGIRGYNWRTGKPTAAVSTYAALVKRLPPREKAAEVPDA